MNLGMRLVGLGVFCAAMAGGGCGPGGGAGGGAGQSPKPATVASHEAAPGAMSPAAPTTKDMKMAEAMFGAGCFWGVEELFRKVPGVLETEVGFAGGKTEKPTYKQVCYEGTGHAEVVHFKYDPTVVSYDQLLDLFWRNHDPTQVNRQGPDYGDQYRTVVFYYSPEQQKAAEASKAALGASGKYKRPIATQIVPAATFWKAEDYHQKYLMKQGLDNCHLPTDGQ